MKQLKHLWDYKWTREAQNNLGIRALKGLFLFLGIMVGCTLLSRAADGLTVAIIEVESPRRSSLTHTTLIEGTLEPLERLAVTTEAGVLVKSVAVTEGDRVESGELLFTFDTQELQKDIQAKHLELNKLLLELNVQKDKDAAREAQLSLLEERAIEDYDAAAAGALRRINGASQALRQARQALRDYGENDTSPDEDQEDGDQDPEYIALRDNYREKKRLYDEAVAQRADTLREAERIIADARLNTDEQLSKKLEIDIELKELEISKLQASATNGGEVYAPTDGIVSALAVEVGKRTTGEVSVYLTGIGDLHFVGELTSEEKKRVEKGMTAELLLPGEREPASGLTVSAIRPLENKAGYSQVSAELPPEDSVTFRQGEDVEARFRENTAPYDSCVPLSCLFYEGPQAYVLTVRQEEGALGMEQRLERINVNVLDHNALQAAVEGPLSERDLLFTVGDKPVGEGDRVRLAGKAGGL